MSMDRESLDEQGGQTLTPNDRRRAQRAKQKYVTQMTPWAAGHASVPVEVVILDISDAGVGIIHDKPLAIGLRHLMTVPREDGLKPIVQEYVVIRCDPRTDGTYTIGLDRVVSRDEAAPPKKRIVSERTKILLLLFGAFGLLIAAFAPL